MTMMYFSDVSRSTLIFELAEAGIPVYITEQFTILDKGAAGTFHTGLGRTLSTSMGDER